MNTDDQESNEKGVVLAVERNGVMHVERESLPIVPAGEVLIEHEVYIDVIDRGHGPFRALSGQTAASGNGYVAELDVDAGVWDILMREDGEVQLQIEEINVETFYLDSHDLNSASGSDRS